MKDLEGNECISLSPQTVQLFKRILDKLKPPEDITVSQWADQYRILSVEGSAEAGQWRTDRTPYLRKPMDCIVDDRVRKVVIKASAQIGKTEMILNTIGRYIDIDPAPMLLVEPTVQAGQDFAKERIDPMLRDTPKLRKLVGGLQGRNTILKKYFPGGYLAVVGANSPTGLASRPIRILLADEIDRWKESAGDEGDPLTIAEKRTTTYAHTHKKVYVSTPGDDSTSRIQKDYLLGSMEIWKLPCPACGAYHELKWANIVFHLDENKNLDETQEVMAVCPSCGELNNEPAWKSSAGKWFPQVKNKEIKSFHMSALISPWKTWDMIVKDFLEAKDDIEMFKVWTNTELGETWVEDGESIDENTLIQRCMPYGEKLPNEILVITAGVDVQDDRFEMEVVGWGEGKKSWGIEYKVIHGDTSSLETWQRLDEHLKATYECEDGYILPINLTCIDSGGHRTTECYEFCKPREHRGVFAIKGKGGTGIHIIYSVSRTKKVKNNLFIIATDIAKSKMFSYLSVVDNEKSGYCFFPDDSEKGYDLKYFEGLTSEVKTIKMVKGRPKTEWKVKKGVRNEPLDCRVYNIAAIEIHKPNFQALKAARNKREMKPKRKRGVVSKGVNVD